MRPDLEKCDNIELLRAECKRLDGVNEVLVDDLEYYKKESKKDFSFEKWIKTFKNCPEKYTYESYIKSDIRYFNVHIQFVHIDGSGYSNTVNFTHTSKTLEEATLRVGNKYKEFKESI